MNHQVTKIALMYIDEHPQHRAVIVEAAQMADAEIADGGSADREVELMIETIQEVVNS